MYSSKRSVRQQFFAIKTKAPVSRGGKATRLISSDVAGLVTLRASARKGGVAIFGCSKAFASGYQRLGVRSRRNRLTRKEATMRPKAILFGGAVFLILIGMTVPVQAGQIKRAVIVGIADYQNINDLAYTVNDAKHIYQRCLWYGVKKNRVKLLTNGQATKKAIKTQCKAMAQHIKPGQTCLFFFSGHGTWDTDVFPWDEADGYDEYLCAYDTSATGLQGLIRDDQLDKWLSPAVNKGANVIAIIDACFSGGAIKRKVSMLGKDADEELLVKTMEGKPEVKITDDFAKDLNKPGFWVMTACDDDEVSYEWSWYQMGVFTFIVDLALSGQADDSWLVGCSGNDNYIMTYDEVHCAIFAIDSKFYSFLTSWQTPQFYGISDIDLFYLQ